MFGEIECRVTTGDTALSTLVYSTHDTEHNIAVALKDDLNAQMETRWHSGSDSAWTAASVNPWGC